MSELSPLMITVRGKHDTGRTTAASFIKMFLEENGYSKVVVRDVAPLPQDQKDDFTRRFERNRGRPVIIRVETEDGSESGAKEADAFGKAAAFFDSIDKRDLERIRSCLSAEKFSLLFDLAELYLAERGD